MTKSAAQQGGETRGPGVAALECSVDRTQALLAEFRGELAQLIAKVHCDVDRLRDVAFGKSPLPPIIDPGSVGDSDAERLAEALDGQQVNLRIRAMIDKRIDERFKSLDDAIRASLQATDPFQGLRSNLSRRGR